MNKLYYQIASYRGKSLLEWAILWFRMSNEAFANIYGFNFNPHKHPNLYEIARNEVFKDEKEEICYD